MRYRTLLFILGLLILFIPEILRIYFIMPFFGSQENNTIGAAYFFHCSIAFFRLAGVLLIAGPVYHYWTRGKTRQKILSGVFVILYALIFYFTNFIAQADIIFVQPRHKIFAAAANNKVDEQSVVLGVTVNGQAKAYPINFIGYHHQVRDTVGEKPVIITYCTVCRSGRAYSPFVNGHYERFRLVGMDHFNAMFEDATTGSWWLQENGKAIAGPLKGTSLDEVPSQQMTLKQWVREHPRTLILQPDSAFAHKYAALKNYDYGLLKNHLEYTDPKSWQMKSWIVGVTANNREKAYDWNDLKKMRVINDTIGKIPVVLVLEEDTMSFHAFHRVVSRETLYFEWNDSLKSVVDTVTHSVWNSKGECIDGAMKGKQLKPVTAYLEYWHSWKQFHPATTMYNSQ